MQCAHKSEDMTSPLLLSLLMTLALALADNTCLLVVGGMGQFNASRSVELWTPDKPPCLLPDLPEEVEAGTLNRVDGVPTVCQLDHCLRLVDGAWEIGYQTLFSRFQFCKTISTGN